MIIDIEKRHLYELAQLYEELSGKPSNIKKIEEQYEMLKKNKDYILVGAEENGKLIGTIMAIECFDLSDECKPFMVIENIVVSKKYHQRGIGRTLMEYCEEEGKKRGCYYMVLVSAAHRKEAHVFYEKIGYNETGAVGFKKYINI